MPTRPLELLNGYKIPECLNALYIGELGLAKSRTAKPDLAGGREPYKRMLRGGANLRGFGMRIK